MKPTRTTTTTPAQARPGNPRLLERLTAEPQGLMPTRRQCPDGEGRRVGVELEFAGLSPQEVARLLVETLDGQVDAKTEYEVEVHTEKLGTLRIEADHERLKNLGRRKQKEGELDLAGSVEEHVLAAAAGRLSPTELVTPPLSLEALPQIDSLADALGEAGARGTGEGVLFAFGTHFNPEVASEDPDDLLAHLQAFALLDPWLRERLGVDSSRRATPFIDPFPEEYLDSLLRLEAVSTTGELIDGYLDGNPTRNRALDMLPLFAHLDAERVARRVDDDRVKARPTFHYRLSDCRIGEEGWRATEGFRLWLIVEDLALDRERLDAMRREFLAPVARPLIGARESWIRRTEEWLS